MHLYCRQVSTLSPRSWRVIISGDGQDKVVDLHDPSKPESEDLIQWYLEDFTDSPFANYRANAAVAELQNYTGSLWQQLQIDVAESFTTLDSFSSITLSIILSKDHNEIDKLHWELLESCKSIPCPIIIHRVLLSDSSPTTLPIPQSVQVHEGILRILIVSARSKKKADLNPRLTTLPLVQTLAGDPRVELEFVHTGTFEEFESILNQRPPSKMVHLVHFDLHGSIDRDKGPVLEFSDSNTKHRTGHTASSVAEVLRRNGVQWVVLCACRTAKVTSSFSHLALEFLNHGVTGVFAMRYELKATAAKILTYSFYLALCHNGKSFIEAGHSSRRAMHNDPSRPARFGENVKIQDSMVPIVYSINGADFRLANVQPADENSNVLLPELIGREDDISQLSTLLQESSFVLLSADIGNSKSILMRHLAWWWKETKLFKRTAYVNVSLAEANYDTNSSVGLLAVAKGIWRSVFGQDAALPIQSDPKTYLFQAMEAAKGQDLLVFLDGIDEIYHPSSQSDDTSEKWAGLFRIARLLSITGFKLLVATCMPLLISPDGANETSLQLGVSMSTEEVFQLTSSNAEIIFPQLDKAEKPQSPDTHLHCTLEVLKYNRTVVKSLSTSLGGRFHGLETVLSWDIVFDENITKTSYLDMFTKKSTAPLSLNLGDSQGLDRTHHLMIAILKHLAQSNRYPDMCVLFSIGLWIDVMPHPEEILDIFENDDISAKIPLLRYVVDNIPMTEGRNSFVPFELWSIMKEIPVPRVKSSFSSKVEIVESLTCVVRLLVAAKLITGRTKPLVDGKQGYQLHPALTIWLRRILRVLPYDVILINFVTCMENRASRMGDANPSVDDFRSGDAKLLRAVESPSFDFVEMEKWNLISAVVVLSQKVDIFSSMGIELPSDTRRFAWTSFFALSPITASREDFCTWFLIHVALKSIKRLAALMPESHTDPLPSSLNHFLFLGLLNWVIWMAQKYRLDDKLAMPLRVRRLLLARVQAMRDCGIHCDEIYHQDFVIAETQAWLNERWITLGSPSTDHGQAAALEQIREKVNISVQGVERGWDMRINLLDSIMSDLSLPEGDSLQGQKINEDIAARDSDPLPDHAAMTSFAMNKFRRSIMAPGKNRDNPTINAWIMDILTFMETDLDFMASMRPWYIHKLIPIFTHIRNGNIPRAIKAALSGLSVAERDGDTLLASNFRQLSRRLADLDTIDEYDAQQTMLARTSEKSVPVLRDLLLIYLANHDTPGAYEHVKKERVKIETDGAIFSALRKMMEGISGDSQGSLLANLPDSDAFSQTGLEGWDQLLTILEPYKNEKLEDKLEWVSLMKQIWNLMDELFNRNTPNDQAWLLDLYRTHPEPRKARDF
ncbi:uncharacterized protein N7479_001241 [Penicillium vulpinum]|uniref:CHAT domain-containing protein n=1 Tax=Penicillium vulpinum TaxID=29845 RepID=A0A1V6S007_9EURO|nr:uncharacterized protein N7479_001241 [Penicillium vulpinum]KAJ5971323.1 hypothetical protein N7479_001241 [Penicillium vulpinum]OQE07089.1 hypothetical protein PENVUL_c015G08116 [Penicillium vulpinum]